MFKPDLALTTSVKDLQSLQGELTRDAGLFQLQRRCFGRDFMKRFSLLICTCLYSLILLYSFRSSAFGFQEHMSADTIGDQLLLGMTSLKLA